MLLLEHGTDMYISDYRSTTPMGEAKGTTRMFEFLLNMKLVDIYRGGQIQRIFLPPIDSDIIRNQI